MKAFRELAWAALLCAAQGVVDAAPGDELYTRPGQLVAADDTRLNLYCTGRGSPAVVFDSGWEDWAPVWAIVQPRVARWTRACSYDRAGAGFSDPGPLPRSSVRIADELHGALKRAGIAGPYILVGNAFGGDNVRTFAARHTADTAGLVLVEADVGGLDEHRGDAQIIANLRDCRDAIAAGKPLPMLPERPGRSPRSCAQQFFRGLPETMWSPELNAKLLELARGKVAMYDSYISEMEQMPEDEAWLAQHEHSLGSRPVRALSTGNHGVHFLDASGSADPEKQAYQRKVASAQAKWLELSSNSKQLFTEKSSEYIPFDQPDFVVEAIHEVYAQASSAPPDADSRVSRDCRVCPEMVVIPAGRFTMGSSAKEKSWAASHGGSMEAVADEAPQHQVSLSSFALGKYDVTRREFAAFARETSYPAGDGCGSGRAIFKWKKDPKLSWEHPGHAQSDRDPVVCVSWQDARAYIEWLNRKAHGAGTTSADGPYRLPSEAEWEYASRAGTTSMFYWGDDDGVAHVHAWFNANSGCENIAGLLCEHGRTHPVGARPPNAFGLYDMAGNVWQWTEDCYDNTYASAPADGRANETPSSDPKARDSEGNCLRVDRGGSWMFPAWLLRPATRERNPVDFRADIMGFRVARAPMKPAATRPALD